MLIDFRRMFPKYGIRPKGVLHIGANVGEEAPVYNELGIKKVFWFEANTELIERLKSNVFRFPNQFVFNVCVGDVDKEVDFNIANNGGQSSSVLELGTHKTAHPDVHYVRTEKVSMRRLDHFLNGLPDVAVYTDLDFLNIDLQGAELMALRGMGDILKQFRWAYLEVNKEELYKGCPNVLDLDLFLNGFGFMRVETKWCGNTGWGDALYIKKP